MIERFGFSTANCSAISSSTTVPDPSSSAPLKIESRRGGRTRRAAAINESIVRCCAAVGMQAGSFAPCGRVTVFTARSESWSTATGLVPT
ncbi:MAG: hypothetical protein U5K74_14470 [Gemmatimonadaceae bacterium]|nr:hypothetical protein [Gemmatimonadaceae bacterium]